jgi:release factor glutamine methyltransferase
MSESVQTLDEVRQAQQRGEVSFCGVSLYVSPDTLVPRRETELLARTTIDAVRASGVERPRVIDMCCGVGNVAVVLAQAVPEAEVWASDLTDATVETARRNADRHGLAERVHVYQGDLFESLRGLGLEGTVDVIACNPPYISTGRLAGDRAELLDGEPREAFDAGPFGVSIHQRLVRNALEFLKPGGRLAFEFGVGQGRQVRLLLERANAYADVRLVTDEETDEERVATAVVANAVA